MKIVVENKIPFIHGRIEAMLPGANVVYAAPEEITPALVADADALIVRTRTRCNAALLGQSTVRFVATATIGMDHIDLPWCAARGITVANAAGCNAPAVAGWVMAALANMSPRPQVLGVVGVGHVGSIVADWAEQLGMAVLRNDPPRALREGNQEFHSLGDLARWCDAITFHTPLDTTTHHLCNDAFLHQVEQHPVILNAARGAVVDTAALISALDQGRVRGAAIDCWENEPEISLPLMERAAIATPHIAGYSQAGKERASAMVLNALAAHLGITDYHAPVAPLPQAPASWETVKARYDIAADTRLFRASPSAMEHLRNSYSLRAE